MSTTGGITKGKSHHDGGIPMVVKSTGQHVELEGGEGVINKRNMASQKTYDFQGKNLTACEIASEINSADGNGVKIDCSGVVGKKYKYGNGGNVLTTNQQKQFDEWWADGNVIENQDGTFSTQDAQYSNKINGLKELKQYFYREFIKGSYSGGGFVDLFEDYENIPPHINTILTQYEEAIEDGDIKGLKELQDDLEQVGYTFEFYVDGSSFGLRPINISINEVEGYEEFKNGGELKMGTEIEMEHAETIKKFKRKGVSVKDVATAIAKDHLKENPKYYSALKQMERELHEGLDGNVVQNVLVEHDLLKRRNNHQRKYKFGGLVNKQPIHMILNTNFSPTLYNMRTGEYSGDSLIRKNELNHFYMLEADAQSITLNYPMTDYYFVVPNSIVEIKGKSRKFDVGGSVEINFRGYDNDLSTNDHAILDILRGVDLEKLTHKDKEFISTFRGDNVINNMPTEYLSVLYSLCFKHHIITCPIRNILLKNLGTGNLLSIAPTYVKNMFIEFTDNKYRPIEELINKAQNAGKGEYFNGDYTDIDCVIMVYPETNPEKELLMDLITKTKREMVVCGVAEFSSTVELKEFYKLITRWTFRNNIYYYVTREGITENGRHTLTYVVNSY